MIATQDELKQGRLSREEAEKLRALLGCTHVAEIDAQARFRTGRLIAEAAYRRQRREGINHCNAEPPETAQRVSKGACLALTSPVGRL
jgi:hypothetical protein